MADGGKGRGYFGRVDKEKVVEYGRKGGEKKGENHLKRKNLKESIELMIESFTKIKARQAKVKGNKDEQEQIEQHGYLIYKLAEALASDSTKDNLKAIELIFDRLEGKAKQNVEVTGENGLPLTPPSLIVEFVDKKQK